MSFTPQHFTVWSEIPAADYERALAFYEMVFKTKLNRQTDGPNPWANFPTNDSKTGISGHVYPGKPAAAGAGPTIHLAVPDSVEETIARVKEAGGKVVSDIISIPEGQFAYCLDSEGNSIGLFSYST